MEPSRPDVQLADVLRCVLAAVERAPQALLAPAFVGRDPLSADVRHGVERLPAELPDALNAALRVAAGRGAAAQLAAMLACVNRGCRAVVAELGGSAEARAARAAHAQAMHDMARALRECSDLTAEQSDELAQDLAAWCCVADASTALDGRVDGNTSPPSKWHALAGEFAHAAAMLPRIRLARREIALKQIVAVASMMRGDAPGESDEDEELTQLAEQERGPWRQRLAELLRDAPA
jgi:hypothetical protein